MPVPADAVLAARRRFFDNGELPEGTVADPILRSWQRCIERGLTGHGLPAVQPLTAYELRELHDRHEKLRRFTRPELETLRNAALRTDSVVILTDASGFVLDMAGNPAFADRASQVLLRPGVHWSETVTGTNAIGTAVVERRAIEVHGPEHFFEPHRVLTCAAVPILDPGGTLAGVLDISGHAGFSRAHTLELVRFAVAQIEHRFFAQGFAHCTRLRFHRDAELLGSAHEAILVFDGGRLVAANRQALQLLGLNWSALHRTRLDDVFATLTPSDKMQTLRSRAGEQFQAMVDFPQETAGRRVAEIARRSPAGVPAIEVEPVLSAETRTFLDRAVRLVEANIPVLVCGETGTGKEVFARRLHAESSRRARPFVAINCAALPESLIESELFGYEEGAFTGARRRGHKGLLRQAEGGILFLDEIGDMPVSLQARLLRVLQDRAVSPLGGASVVPVDFALICATHRPLDQLVAAGTFRQDLFFRIAPFVVDLPPFRGLPDRTAVMRALWTRLGGDAAGSPLSRDLLQRLEAYDWPGNFRQVVNLLRTLLVLAEPGRPVELSVLPPELQRPPARVAGEPVVDQPLAVVTKAAMRAALEASAGNISLAARRLGVDRSTVYRQLLWQKRIEG